MKSLTIVSLTVLNAVAMPFAIEKLWNWFLVPVTGYKPLSFWGAFGLMILASLLTTQWSKDTLTQMSDEEIIKLRFTKLFFTGFAMLFGWMAHACL